MVDKVEGVPYCDSWEWLQRMRAMYEADRRRLRALEVVCWLWAAAVLVLVSVHVMHAVWWPILVAVAGTLGLGVLVAMERDARWIPTRRG